MYPVPDFERKICPAGELTARAAALPRPLVFTNGCFDVLHRGHVTYLAQARALGASLIIGANSDASVKRQGKGDDRPINSEQDRMMVLAALESVSLVVKFDEDTPLESDPCLQARRAGERRRLEDRKHRWRKRCAGLGRRGTQHPFFT